MEKAPYLNDIVSDPCDVQAYWLLTKDKVRIRVAIWQGGERGTIFILTGRTEYIEKYAAIANLFSKKGYNVVIHDWRGQGLSQRFLPNSNIGHVEKFSDYQLDLDEVIDTAENLELPQPFFQVSHSMGGCIGLRTLHQKNVFKSSVFTGPMWKIHGKPLMLAAKYVTALAVALGLGKRLIIGADERNYLHLSTPEKNSLTTDPETFLFLKSQIEIHPELNVGGPSWRWLEAAIKESDFLISRPPPDASALVILGTEEVLVDMNTIISYCQDWNKVNLEIIPETKHEVLMESKVSRDYALNQIFSFLES
ncbi:MAG: alpha/beta hydrolase [Paracoccaceae bacterium]|nr:alpha/beta hydrolase [Paracoccaceae bacterium]MDE2675515.1 alpha/beta hydrolase [Paracoccaceae bacterium]